MYIDASLECCCTRPDFKYLIQADSWQRHIQNVRHQNPAASNCFMSAATPQLLLPLRLRQRPLQSREA